MYCIRCGNQLKDGTRYCIYCGEPTVEEKKQKSNSTDDDTSSIPVDFFSNRIVSDDTGEFNINIPDDFVNMHGGVRADPVENDAYTQSISIQEVRKMMRTKAQMADAPKEADTKLPHIQTMDIPVAEPNPVPDEAGEPDYTQMIAKADIKEAILEREMALEDNAADEAGEPDYTQVIASADLEETILEREMAPEDNVADEAGKRDYTQVIASADLEETILEQEAAPADEIPANEAIPVQDIPDIHIPKDFIAEEPESDIAEDGEADNRSDSPEQIISARGIVFVIIVVVLLFAVAAGACVMAMRGGAAPAAGSGSAAAAIAAFTRIC